MRTGGRPGRVRWLFSATLALGLIAVASPGWAVTLDVTTSDIDFPDLTLDGTTKTTTAIAATWTITDARLVSQPWTVTISATDPTSAAGTVETTARSIAASNLVVSTGVFTGDLLSDPPTNILGASNLVLSSTPQTLASTTGNSQGIYSYTPTFSLTMPANAFRSNYSGAVGSSSLNPYTSTITVTIS